MNKIALCSGVTGQDGSYLVELLLDKGYVVHGIIRRSSTFNTGRIDHLMTNPKINGKTLHIHFGDLTDGSSITNLVHDIKPNEIYNLGAQSHVRVSFDVPEFTGDSVGLGTLRLLEAIRRAGIQSTCRYYQASSSEMFGKVQATPQVETTPFWPRSPYGCAKVYAHWLTVNYRESYGMHASNGILYNHECVTEETPVIFRRNGVMDIREIQDIVPHREHPRHGTKYQTIPEGLDIWDGDKWAAVTAATATWNDGGKKVHAVLARGGFYRATSDHISFLDDRTEIKTADLKPGDRIQLYPLPESTSITAPSALEAEWLGLMAGDGYICPEGGSARFTNLDEKLLELAKALFIAISGGNARIDRSKRSGYTDTIVPSVEFSNASRFFQLWRSELYDERGKKRVPIRILNAPSDIQSAFLAGYNKADGLKAGNRMNRTLKSFKTNSTSLAQGLAFLAENIGYRVTVYVERDQYYTLNIGLVHPAKGLHLQKPLNEVRSAKQVAHTGWLFDLATHSGTFSCGIGRTWVHNSPRRGETFVTRKITRAATRIKLGLQNKLILGNLDAKRDWGYAKEYVEMMWLMLQQDKPDDYIAATGETHSVKEFCQRAFEMVGLDWEKYVVHGERYERPAEVDILLGNAAKAKKKLGWTPKVKFKDLVSLMVAADMELAQAEFRAQEAKI